MKARVLETSQIINVKGKSPWYFCKDKVYHEDELDFKDTRIRRIVLKWQTTVLRRISSN